MSQLLQQGDKVNGYTVERLIGKGALGEVYLARRSEDGESLALKVLLPEAADDNPEYIQRFVREGNLVRKMSHPNMVAVHDVGYCTERGLYYLVMDYISGSSLRTAIGIAGAMDPQEAIRIVACVASVLASGERYGLVHRDIKPENIMIKDDGVVKLVDFGVVKSSEADTLRTMSNTVFGTPNYISPEQAMDSSKVDCRADVYSLGIVLFEMLSGKLPYEGRNPAEAVRFLFSPEPIPDLRTVRPDIQPAVAELVSRMCEKDAEKRISSASGILDELRQRGLMPESLDPTGASAVRRGAEDDKPFDYAAFADQPMNNTLSFDTKDTEISDFVAKLKARRRRRKRLYLLAAVAAAVASLSVLGLAAFLLRHP